MEKIKMVPGSDSLTVPLPQTIMGIHHAWGRTLKDLYIRYNAIQGKSCQYQNGFDAQGLWVEVEVEKEIGVSNKKKLSNTDLIILPKVYRKE